MPRTRSLAWAELKIGLVSIFALVMAALLIFLLSGEGGFFWQRYGLKTVFANVAGLKAGAPVRVAGVEVGRGDRRGVHRRPRRGADGGQQGDAAAHHLVVGGVARLGVAARRVGGGHHRVEPGHAGAGVGLRAVGPGGRVAHRRGREGVGRHRSDQRARRRHPVGPGHGGQAVHRGHAAQRARRRCWARTSRWRGI